MSSETVKGWEQYSESIPKKGLWPKGTPRVTCLEDLTVAAKAVHKSFREAASSLKCSKQDCLNKFDKRKYGDPVWFRGETNKNRSLSPSIFRLQRYLGDVKGNRSTEKWMLMDFWRRAVLRDPYCPGPDRMEAWLALAQHHGLPTRLLDWSESIFTAAWFATYEDEASCRGRLLAKLCKAVSTKSGKLHEDIRRKIGTEMARSIQEEARVEAQPVIWALSPGLLNWKMRHTGPIFFLNQATDFVMDAFNADSNAREKALAVWIQDVHPRMFMQTGAFTIHSTDESLEAINKVAPLNQRFLRKLVFAGDRSRTRISDALATIGVSAATVYPDLDHLAQEIRERWDKMVAEIKQEVEREPSKGPG